MIQTSAQTIDIAAVELPDAEVQQPGESAHLTVSAIANSLLNTSGDSLLEGDEQSQHILTTRTSPTKLSEKAFQALVSKLTIHAPAELYSQHFDRVIPARCEVDSAQFAIQIIAEKNTVGKY